MNVPYDPDLAEMGWIYPDFEYDMVRRPCDCVREVRFVYDTIGNETPSSRTMDLLSTYIGKYGELCDTKINYFDGRREIMYKKHTKECYKLSPRLVWYESPDIPKVLSKNNWIPSEPDPGLSDMRYMGQQLEILSKELLLRSITSLQPNPL